MTLAVLLQTVSVSRTAHRLGISQPTVSRSLNQLRQLLGDPLLLRSGSGMILTPRAQELTQPMEEWMGITSTILQARDFDPAQMQRRFRIAANDFGVMSVLAPHMPLLHNLAPHCRIDVTGHASDMFQKLASGEIDLIFQGHEPDPSIYHARHVFSEKLALVMRQGHPLIQTTNITQQTTAPTLDAYLQCDHIAINIGSNDFDPINAKLGERHQQRRIVLSVPYCYAALDLIGSSDMVLTLPSQAARRMARQGHLATMPAPPEMTGFDYWIVWHTRSARDPATLWLIDLLAGDEAVASPAATRASDSASAEQYPASIA